MVILACSQMMGFEQRVCNKKNNETVVFSRKSFGNIYLLFSRNNLRRLFERSEEYWTWKLCIVIIYYSPTKSQFLSWQRSSSEFFVSKFIRVWFQFVPYLPSLQDLATSYVVHQLKKLAGEKEILFIRECYYGNERLFWGIISILLFGRVWQRVYA